MAIEIVHTKGGPRGRDTTTGKFAKIPSSLGTKPLPAKVVPNAEAFTEGMELSGGGTAALGGIAGAAGGAIQAVVSTLEAISSKIDTLISVTQETLGVQQDENKLNELESERDLQDRRDERLESRDRDKRDKGEKGPGILGSIGDMFKSFGGFVKDKAMGLGDFVKMFLFAGGLWLLSKYSDQLVKYLSPVLKYFKEDFLPDMEEFGTWVVEKLAPFVKQSWLFIKNTIAPALKSAALWFTKIQAGQTESFEDEFGRMHTRTAPGVMALDWDKIKKALMIGIGTYLTLKFLPFILFSIGGRLLAIPGLGLAVGIVGLGAYLIWSAIKMAGQAVLDSATWTKDTGATDDPNANAVGAFFGGKIEGGWRNAIQNAGKWAKWFGIAGFTVGLFGGPIGAVAGGVLGVAIGTIFGGILGLIGGGWIAKIYQWIKDSILNVTNKTKDMIVAQETAALKRGIIEERLAAGDTLDQAYEAAGININQPDFMIQREVDALFGNQGFGTTGSVESYIDTSKAMDEAIGFDLKPVKMSELIGWDDDPVKAINDRLFALSVDLPRTQTLIDNATHGSEEWHHYMKRKMMLDKEVHELNNELNIMRNRTNLNNVVQPLVSTSGKSLSYQAGQFMHFQESFAANRASQPVVTMLKQGDNVTSNTANQYIGSYDVNNMDRGINGLNIFSNDWAAAFNSR